MILAADVHGGIGKGGTLPWNIPSDLKHFQKLTRGKGDSSSVVIMGRNTWNSIPEKFRPLKGRTNIVISRTLKNENCIVHGSIEAAMKHLTTMSNIDEDKIWCIGGAQLYNTCLDYNLVNEIYLTKVQKDFDCDIKLSNLEDILKLYRETSDDHFDSKHLHCENDVNFTFHKFVKNS